MRVWAPATTSVSVQQTTDTSESAAAASMLGARTSTSGSIRVPFDHTDPIWGTFPLSYELGAPFDPRKPTVFLAADAQQFWVRPGSVARLQAKLIGSELNVVGVIPRNQSSAIVERVSAARPVDWAQAYRLLHSGQLVSDIDAVRCRLLGDDGHILLYGRSGGAFLAHAYLATHCEHVERSFTRATVMPFVQAELGVPSDRSSRPSTASRFAFVCTSSINRSPT